ncbi:O-antigen ligase family protein [Stutzerimonas nitrititolerans]
MQERAHGWLAFGFIVFLVSAFFLEGSQTLFYILVALPALLFLGRLKTLVSMDSWGVCSILAFLGYFSLSALWSSGDGSLQTALKFSLYIICLALAIEAAVKRFSMNSIVITVAVAAAIAAIAYLVSVLVGDIPYRRLITGRFSLKAMAGWGPDNPITSGVVFGLAVISAWWLFPRRAWYVQVVLMLLILASLLLMFVSKSRGPFVALPFALLLLVCFRRSRADFVLAAGLGLAMLLCVVLLNLDEIALNRAAAPNYRLGIWMQALERIREHWMFGQGFGHDARILLSSGRSVTHSHSFVLEIFRQGGVVGGGLFLLMLVLLLRRALVHPAGFFLLWLIYGAVCLSTNGRIVLSRPSVEWFSFWLPLLLAYFAAIHARVGREQPGSDELLRQNG